MRIMFRTKLQIYKTILFTPDSTHMQNFINIVILENIFSWTLHHSNLVFESNYRNIVLKRNGDYIDMMNASHNLVSLWDRLHELKICYWKYYDNSDLFNISVILNLYPYMTQKFGTQCVFFYARQCCYYSEQTS